MTIQYISIPKRFIKEVDKIRHPKIKILEKHIHKNKLQIGHLKGNRILGVSVFTLNAYVPVTLVGQAEGKGEKANKEALCDLSNQVSVTVKSEFKEFQKAIQNSYKSYKHNLIETL
jgi:hypothetical protein